tara:strand:+ start:962 stop:1429 length:468 start_codon:yes stop_codon:yes gene_type:complete
MLKNIFLIIVFTLITGCGFEAKYSKKNRSIDMDFSFNQINFEGNKEVNQLIKRRLNNLSKSENNKNYDLLIKTETNKSVIAKNLKGDPSIFKLEMNVDVQLIDENNKIVEIQFIEIFKYDNNSDKFELKRYEKEINSNLVEAITEDLISKLSGGY